MRTEVYSWRLSVDLKSELEREARRRKVSVSRVVENAVREHLSKAGESDEEEQRRLSAAAEACIGIIDRASPHRSRDVRATVRAGVKRRRER